MIFAKGIIYLSTYQQGGKVKDLEKFLRTNFPEEFAAPFGANETLVDKTIRLLSYTHQIRRQVARSAHRNGVLDCQVGFARRALELVQSGKLSGDALSQVISDALAITSKESLARQIKDASLNGEEAQQPCNDRRCCTSS